MSEPAQPQLPDQTWPCPTCKGHGTTTIHGHGTTTIAAYAGLRGVCPVCLGAGWVPWDPDDPEFKGF